MSNDKKQLEPKPEGITLTAEAFENIITKVVTQSTAAAAALISTSQPKAPVALPPRTFEKCAECFQYAEACKGEHVEMVVYPVSAKHGKWFPGVIVNGVRYLSDHGGHRIKVPKENNIAAAVVQWEQNEEEMLNGRTKFHNSGSIFAPRPAHEGWR